MSRLHNTMFAGFDGEHQFCRYLVISYSPLGTPLFDVDEHPGWSFIRLDRGFNVDWADNLIRRASGEAILLYRILSLIAFGQSG
jgi:hypothetical protein